MMSLRFSTLMLGVLAALFLTTSSCKKDEDPVATTAKIKGTITYLNVDVWQTWKDSGEVQLTLFPEFSLNPPAGWGPIPDNAFGTGVPGGTFAAGAPVNAQDPAVLEYSAGATGVDYELEVDPGTYSALAVGFRHNTVVDPSLRTATLGVYYGNPAIVSHGIVIKANIGGTVMTLFNYPPPATFTVNAGDELTIDFAIDFGFIEDWYR